MLAHLQILPLKRRPLVTAVFGVVLSVDQIGSWIEFWRPAVSMVTVRLYDWNGLLVETGTPFLSSGAVWFNFDFPPNYGIGYYNQLYTIGVTADSDPEFMSGPFLFNNGSGGGGGNPPISIGTVERVIGQCTPIGAVRWIYEFRRTDGNTTDGVNITLSLLDAAGNTVLWGVNGNLPLEYSTGFGPPVTFIGSDTTVTYDTYLPNGTYTPKLQIIGGGSAIGAPFVYTGS